MAVNKIFLDTDGLAVGNGQLVTSGNSVSIGNSLFVSGNFYAPSLARTVTLTGTYNSNTTTYNANGYITSFTQGTITTSNVVYNTLGLPTSWIETETAFGPSVSYTYTATYDGSGFLTTITRQ